MHCYVCYLKCFDKPLNAYHSFFFNDTATTEIYTLSLHDALPISEALAQALRPKDDAGVVGGLTGWRSEEHTSELQSRGHLVCRLLLEKKNKCPVSFGCCFKISCNVCNLYSMTDSGSSNGLLTIQ